MNLFLYFYLMLTLIFFYIELILGLRNLIKSKRSIF